MHRDELFGLRFANIPIMNLRFEFNQSYAFVFDQQAERSLQPPIEAVRAPLFVWCGMPDDLFTLLLQRAVLGVEAYLPAALKFAAAQLGKVSTELFKKLDDPFSLGGASLVANVYHRMPSAVHSELSLRHLDEELYERTRKFYKQIRNPLFHGRQLHDTEIGAVRKAFDHVAQLYEWIDYWHNPELQMKGFGQVAGVRKRHSPAEGAA